MLQKLKVFAIPALFGLLFLVTVGFFFLNTYYRKSPAPPSKLPEVEIPTIGSEGELILPGTESAKLKNSGAPVLAVLSANLAGVFDKEKMTGIRILGETQNFGDAFIESVDPIVRFYDKKGMIGQKIAKFTVGFDFKETPSKGKNVYDITVDSPPASEKLEIIFNVSASSESASLLVLKVASKSMELKTADVNSENKTAKKVTYYSISGQILNTFNTLVSDAVVYAWGKDSAGKVFSFGRADFKNDLISPLDKVDFKIILLPINAEQKLDSYEVAAWGKEYKLLTSPIN